MTDRFSVSVSEFGSVTVDFLYYKKYLFFIGADYAEDAESVMQRIEEKYILENERGLDRGFEKYRDKIREAIKSELDGAEF